MQIKFEKITYLPVCRFIFLFYFLWTVTLFQAKFKFEDRQSVEDVKQ